MMSEFKFTDLTSAISNAVFDVLGKDFEISFEPIGQESAQSQVTISLADFNFIPQLMGRILNTCVFSIRINSTPKRKISYEQLYEIAYSLMARFRTCQFANFGCHLSESTFDVTDFSLVVLATFKFQTKDAIDPIPTMQHLQITETLKGGSNGRIYRSENSQSGNVQRSLT